MIEQLPVQWRACVLCGNVRPIRQRDDMCKKCQRVAKQSVRREEREWLGRYVTSPLGTGQVVGLAPLAPGPPRRDSSRSMYAAPRGAHRRPHRPRRAGAMTTVTATLILPAVAGFATGCAVRHLLDRLAQRLQHRSDTWSWWS
jgi:hypothetical protein